MEPTTIQDRKELQAHKSVRKVLLICGILSSLLYVGTDILGGMLWEGYSFTSQAISELAATGQVTSWFGAIERINVYGYLLWVAVLSIVLLQEEKRPGAFG